MSIVSFCPPRREEICGGGVVYKWGWGEITFRVGVFFSSSRRGRGLSFR